VKLTKYDGNEKTLVSSMSYKIQVKIPHTKLQFHMTTVWH